MPVQAAGRAARRCARQPACSAPTSSLPLQRMYDASKAGVITFTILPDDEAGGEQDA